MLRPTARWLARTATVDPRTLGLFRIAFGLLLLGNLYDRLGGLNFLSFYTNEGIYPNHYALYLPPAGHYWSLLLGLSSPAQCAAGYAVVALIYALYTLGWQTRLVQLLALVCVISVDNRFILIQHGGNVVMNIAAVWTLFLPLGERLSLDALLRARVQGQSGPLTAGSQSWFAPSPRQHVGLAYLCLCLELACIYFFNALHKSGPSWTREGSVIHYLLWQNRIATTFAGMLRLHEPSWLSPLLTFSTLVLEWSLPLLILAPFWRRWTRALAIAFIALLHGGIALLVTLGPFSYAMMALSLLLVQPEHWSALERWLDAKPSRREALTAMARPLLWLSARLAPPSPRQEIPHASALGLIARTALPLALALAVGSQLLMENRGVASALKPRSRPEWMTTLVEGLVIPQGWGMFAPDAPLEDGRLVVDARLVDGTHVDPLTGAAPDFEPWLHGPWGMDQHWCEVHGRMPGWRQHWRNFRDYLLRRPQLLGWPPSRRIVELEVFWISNRSPPPGSTTPQLLKRERLFGLSEPL